MKHAGFRQAAEYSTPSGYVSMGIHESNPYRFRLEFVYPDGTRSHKTIDFTPRGH